MDTAHLTPRDDEFWGAGIRQPHVEFIKPPDLQPVLMSLILNQIVLFFLATLLF